MTAFIVDGQALATVPQDRSSLRLISHEVTVRSHINGTAAGSASPAGSPASPRPSPSGSPAGTPAASPSPTKTP